MRLSPHPALHVSCPLLRCWWQPGSRESDVCSAVAVACHRDAGGAGELDPVVGDPPAPVTEATPELFPADVAVFAAYPSDQPQPRVVVDRVERRRGHPVSEVVRPYPQRPTHRADPSGSTGPTRLRRGCSHPPRRSPDQAAASFTPPLRRQGAEGLPPPSDQTRIRE